MTTPTKSKRTKERKMFLHGVFTTAMEGGIGYWSAATEYHWMKPEFKDVPGYPPDVEDLDGFHAVIVPTDETPVSDEDERGCWGVWADDVDKDTGELRIDIDVIARGIGLFVDYAKGRIDANGKPTPDGKPVPLDHYWRQFIEANATNGDEGDYDSDVADAIVQFGLFGQVVYG